MNFKFKFIFMSIIVLGLIVNTASFSDLAFAEKPDKEAAKEAREAAKGAKADILEFVNGVVLNTSSTTTICHAPPGNPGNAHTITIGKPAVRAHFANHAGDTPGPCGPPM